MSPIACLLLAFQDSPTTPAAADSAGRSMWIDIACLVLILVSALLGARRGLWWQFVRLLGLLATLSVARAVAPRLSAGLTGAISAFSPEFANGLAWSVILLAGLVIVGLLMRFARLMIESGELSGGDRLGGAVLGLVTGGVLATGLLICTSQIASANWVEHNLRGSRAQYLVDGVARAIPSALDPIAAGRVSGEVRAAEPQEPSGGTEEPVPEHH